MTISWRSRVQVILPVGAGEEKGETAGGGSKAHDSTVDTGGVIGHRASWIDPPALG